MLPIMLMSLRNGPKWGVGTAFIFSLIQFLLEHQQPGLLPDHRRTDRLRAAGLPAGLLRAGPGLPAGPCPQEWGCAGIAVGTVVVCLLRFVCSFLSGYIVWKDYDYAFEWLNNFGWGAWFTAHLGENALCWFYSFAYNLSYMLPETILTVVGALLIYKAAPRLFKAAD